jgi:hypothetical protein
MPESIGTGFKILTIIVISGACKCHFIFLSYQFEPNMVKEADLIFTAPTDGLFASDHFGIQVVLNRLP